jgi:hypothetical protein
MPIEDGAYCEYCTDAEGNLQPFDVRFTTMCDWQSRRDPSASRSVIEATTLAYMGQMPAWADNPDLLERLARSE